MEYIEQLYEVEAQTKHSIIEERASVRAQHAQPVLTAFFAWLHDIAPRVAPNSATDKAVMYALNRQSALSHYAHTGGIPIDNNPIENAIRHRYWSKLCPA